MHYNTFASLTSTANIATSRGFGGCIPRELRPKHFFLAIAIFSGSSQQPKNDENKLIFAWQSYFE